MERVTPAERVDDVLTPEQTRVMTRVLAQEEARREHLVVEVQQGGHGRGLLVAHGVLTEHRRHRPEQGSVRRLGHL